MYEKIDNGYGRVKTVLFNIIVENQGKTRKQLRAITNDYNIAWDVVCFHLAQMKRLWLLEEVNGKLYTREYSMKNGNADDFCHS